MALATARDSTPRARLPEFLIAVNRIRLSQMIHDPFVAAAFKAAEDDGLAPLLVGVDHPTILSSGAAEAVQTAVRGALVEMEG